MAEALREDVVTGVVAAAKSLADSTEAHFRVGYHLEVHGDRLRSPYISRRRVMYGLAKESLPQENMLLGWNRRFTLLVQLWSEREPLVPAMPTPDGFVGEWAGGEFPVRIFAELYARLRRWGVEIPLGIADTAFVSAFIIRPALAGWNADGRPIPIVADQDNRPLDVPAGWKDFPTDFEPDVHIWLAEPWDVPAPVRTLWPGAQAFGLRCLEAPRMTPVEGEPEADVVALHFAGDLWAACQIAGGSRLQYNGKEVIVPDDGIALIDISRD